MPRLAIVLCAGCCKLWPCGHIGILPRGCSFWGPPRWLLGEEIRTEFIGRKLPSLKASPLVFRLEGEECPGVGSQHLGWCWHGAHYKDIRQLQERGAPLGKGGPQVKDEVVMLDNLGYQFSKFFFNLWHLIWSCLNILALPQLCNGMWEKDFTLPLDLISKSLQTPMPKSKEKLTTEGRICALGPKASRPEMSLLPWHFLDDSFPLFQRAAITFQVFLK